MSLLIQNATVITPGIRLDNAAILLQEGKIRRVFPQGDALPQADEYYDAQGLMVFPGFIDMHFHGAMGYETTTDDPKAMDAIGRAKILEGVTDCCPTTLTLSEERLAKSMAYIEEYRKNPTGADIIGTHLEGPYVNPECLGAQNPAYQRNPDSAEIQRLHKVSPVSLITYAIELPGALEFTEDLLHMGILPSCGHTSATTKQFAAGQARGLRRLTHYCNQMTKLHHREIGMVGTGLRQKEVYLEMICDKIHLCPDMIDLIFRTKNLDHILLITDAMEASHLQEGKYQLGGLDVIVKDGAARLASNGALAGSILKMNDALKNVYQVTGLPLEELVRTTSLNQAQELGITDLGRIEAGFRANLAILDQDFQVKQVFLHGKKMIG
ncbi:MAG: N-acetylglucosamine-6-phosphate deacetylase [Oligosphaeraceae bacterium]